MNPRLRNYLKLFAKLLLTALALYFIYTRIDFTEAFRILRTARLFFLLPALILFAASKLLSALRLEYFFKAIELFLDRRKNIYLYLLGMYYNLFLPGGIGGDGYKAYWINKRYDVSLKSVIGALLMDRINGLWALLFLGGLGLLFLPAGIFGFNHRYIAIVGLILSFPLYYWGISKWFNAYKKVIIRANLYSIGVQILQLLCMLCLVSALTVNTSSLLNYGIVFLLSSIVAVLPLTIGGIGSREVVFLLGAQWLDLDQDMAVTASLLFYLITVCVSLLGVYFVWFPTLLEPKRAESNSDLPSSSLSNE